ncbi:putative serine carboxypeptidase [Paramyrothecium foliicola]|nr:putative serine carboxypeptidase [Paramyrothecium foliicola]
MHTHFAVLGLMAAASTVATASPPAPLESVATEFPVQQGLPAFSLRLGQGQKEDNPSTVPVILWMSGGPGASSVGIGGLVELGPCRVDVNGDISTIDNDYSWNANSTLLIVDQPLGVGYSNGDDAPTNLNDATSQMHQFLQQFFTAFPNLGERDFYIAGESYGGTWVPTLGARIIERQSSALAQRIRAITGYRPRTINLRGIMVGNGEMKQSVQNVGAFETGCGRSDSPLNATICAQWAPTARRCEAIIPVVMKTTS